MKSKTPTKTSNGIDKLEAIESPQTCLQFETRFQKEL